MSKTRVTSVPGVYSLDGKAYGPFEATGDKAFVEVPTELAEALNLPTWKDPDAPEPEPEEEGENAPADTSALQGEIDTLTTERNDLRRELEELKAKAPEATPAALPADARDRLIAIQGIGERLADKVLEVLNAPAEPASE